MSPDDKKYSESSAHSNKVVVSLLVAADEKNIIGKNNQLPWHLPNDLKYFKNQTWGMPILMGRKTFESIGKALPGRKSIVITRDSTLSYKDVSVVHSVQSAIEKAKEFGALEIFVIGGAEVFREAFQYAARIYMTRIHHFFEGDVYFPEIIPEHWQKIKSHHCEADEKNAFSHTFQVWEKRTPEI